MISLQSLSKRERPSGFLIKDLSFLLKASRRSRFNGTGALPGIAQTGFAPT
jgi:hypothetical protein